MLTSREKHHVNTYKDVLAGVAYLSYLLPLYLLHHVAPFE
jgi:hypothetical protein